MEEKYIVALDVGTTTIRSFIYNSRTDIVDKATDQIILHYPCPGYVEIDPDELWSSVVKVVKESLQNAKLSPSQVTALGISTQRGSFITWSKTTGKPYHKIISWKDLRADKLVREWNHSLTFKVIRTCSYVLYLLSRVKRFKAGSTFKFMNNQTTLRLCWALQHVAPLAAGVRAGDALFGTLDTWLLHKLTGGKVHVTDASSASATGFFDPFTMGWAGWALGPLRIPAAILPPVVDTVGDHFTSTDKEIWGDAIPIRCCMADQTAAMWGACCFDVDDLKLTLGTGMFLDINTGSSPHPGVAGLYPVVGWRCGDELVFVAEGSNNDTATIINWGQKLGLFHNPKETSEMAYSVPDTDGVYFIPSFSGLGPPYNDVTVASGFVGTKPSTTKAHMVRALLESLAFRAAQIVDCARAETHDHFHTIRLDGGVSNNDFIAQLIADLTGLRVERPANVEMSSLGCAHIIGLHIGIWKSKKELQSLRRVERVFPPRAGVGDAYRARVRRWEDAVRRLSGWYEKTRGETNAKAVSVASQRPLLARLRKLLASSLVRVLLLTALTAVVRRRYRQYWKLLKLDLSA